MTDINPHLDILGRELKVGMPVAVSAGTVGLKICTISALTPKMVRVAPVKKQTNWRGKEKTYLEYGSQMVIIGGEDVLMYVLKHGGD
jgi:hypothetical protein